MRISLHVSVRKLVTVISMTILLMGIVPVHSFGARQVSGTLIGQVFDTSGQPLPGVTVRITNLESGNTYATQTDQTGTYRRPLLHPGNYRITASKQGFNEGTVDASVNLNTTKEIKPPAITLQPSSTTAVTTQPTPTTQTPTPAVTPQVVTPVVTDESSTLVNRVDPARGGNFTDLQLRALPLGGGNTMRSFDELALLVPGVAPPPYTPGVRGPGIGFGIGSAGQFSVNGMRARSNNFNIDGSDNNDPDVGVRRQGFVALVPQPIESVQEFQIQTLLWNAESGRNMGSQVNAVSKIGGSSFHGQAYGFFTHNKLNARNAFDFLGGDSDGEDPLTRVQAGFVIGGPIKRDRTQFFGSYEFLNLQASTEQHFATPSLAERRFLGAPAFVVPLSADLAFATLDGVTPSGANIFSFYPRPNNIGGPFGANTYTEILPSDATGSIASFRVTDRTTLNNTLHARYNFTDDNRVLPSVKRAIRSSIEADTRTQDVSLILDSALTPLLFNQARFSFGRTRLSFPPYATTPSCDVSEFCFSRQQIVPVTFITGDGEILEVPRPTSTGPIGELIIQPFSPVGVDVFTFPQSRVSNTFQVADTLSWTVRQHSLRFGADVRRIQLNSRQDRNYRPLVSFNNGVFQPRDLEGNPVGNRRLFRAADIASLGFASQVFQTVTSGTPDSTIGLRFTEYNFFVNDNVRVRPNFTLDFGVRYEYNTVPREANSRIEDALTAQRPSPGASVFDTPEDIQAFNDTFDAYKRVLGGRERIYEPDRNNFGPHIGFAWSPASTEGFVAKLTGGPGQMAIRGGYGVYFDTILGAVVSQSRNIFPNEFPLTIDPISFGTSIFSLTNPASISIIHTVGGQQTASTRLIARDTLNQFGGAPQDFVALLGFIFRNSRRAFPDGSSTTRSGLTFTLPDKDLRTPYGQQWHLTIERQVMADYLVSAAYVGTKGTKLTRLTTPNLGPNLTPSFSVVDADSTVPILFTFGQFLLPRPEFNLGAYQIFEDSASSNYHALQLEARKRYSKGYSFTLAYTWSHAVDDVSDVFPIAGAPVLPQDSRDFQSERGDANFDVRQRFSASMVIDLPFYRNSVSSAAKVLGGWQVTSIFQAHTGQPFTLNVAFDSNLDGNLTDRPSTTSGLSFFKNHGSRRVAVAAGRGLTSFFVLGNNGVVGRNTVRADGFVNLDLALSKRFRFTEYQNLEFRAEIFNALNRANYGIPVRVIGAPGFGSSYDTVNPARIIQLALKYSF